MKKNVLIVLLLCGLGQQLQAQNKDSLAIRGFFENAFLHGKSYYWLSQLCNIGGRLSGSPQAASAVDWAYQILKNECFDTVYLQPVMVPHWVRGSKEIASIHDGIVLTPVNICALGNSVGTGPLGLTAKVVEVKSFEELHELGMEKVKGKIVFFNRPFREDVLSGGAAYGGAVNQRSQGPIEAAKLGAVGVVVRSMTHALDDFPHTGATHYEDSIQKIPACAISTKGANLLSEMLKKNPNLMFHYRQTCEFLPEVQSYNVIAEIKGKEKPEEIILVGGHLDAWDNGQGAHDDGSGSVQSMEALRLIKQSGLIPKRTLRAVLFMNEENGLKGGLKYAEEAAAKKEKNIVAIESDEGGFMPRYLGVSAQGDTMAKINSWLPLLAPYGIQSMNRNGGGADIGPLAKQGTILVGYYPDEQKYFDYHHTANDTIDKVHKRELQFGAVVLSGLLFLFSEYGL